MPDVGTSRVGAKVFAAPGASVDLPAFIPAFHGWIQRASLEGLLIDVADYQHVPDGPGIMLIGHEADRALDMSHGRPGMLYQHKRDDRAPSLPDAVRRALRQAALAAAEAERDPALEGGPAFPGDELMVRVTDRRAFPAGAEGSAALERATREVLDGAGLGGGGLVACHDDDPKAAPTVFVTLADPPGAAGLAEALGQAPPVAP